MEGDWSPAEPWVGALCDPPTGAAHHAFQATPELPAAAGDPGCWCLDARHVKEGDDPLSFFDL